MNRIVKNFTLTIFFTLCGCEISTPPLPPIDQQTFSYDQMIQQKTLMELEINAKTEQ